jgi:hypothetical protein
MLDKSAWMLYIFLCGKNEHFFTVVCFHKTWFAFLKNKKQPKVMKVLEFLLDLSYLDEQSR